MKKRQSTQHTVNRKLVRDQLSQDRNLIGFLDDQEMDEIVTRVCNSVRGKSQESSEPIYRVKKKIGLKKNSKLSYI